MSKYVDVGVISYGKHGLENLPVLVDAAIRKEGAFWGGGRVNIFREDINIAVVEHQFRFTKFAGLVWAKSHKQVAESVEYLIVVAGPRDRPKIKSRLKESYPNVKRVKFIHPDLP